MTEPFRLEVRRSAHTLAQRMHEAGHTPDDLDTDECQKILAEEMARPESRLCLTEKGFHLEVEEARDDRDRGGRP